MWIAMVLQLPCPKRIQGKEETIKMLHALSPEDLFSL
jgi:hypothetical protein